MNKDLAGRAGAVLNAAARRHEYKRTALVVMERPQFRGECVATQGEAGFHP
jgi:hypothetical protein